MTWDKEHILLRAHVAVAHVGSSMLFLYAPILIAMNYQSPLMGIYWLLVVHIACLLGRFIIWVGRFNVTQAIGAMGLLMRASGLTLPLLGPEWIWPGGIAAGLGSSLFFGCSSRMVYAHASSQAGKLMAGNEFAYALGSLTSALIVAANLISPGANALIAGSAMSVLAALLLMIVPMADQDEPRDARLKIQRAPVPMRVFLANHSMANEIVILAPLIVASGSKSGWLAIAISLIALIMSPIMGKIYDARHVYALLGLGTLSVAAWIVLYLTTQLEIFALPLVVAGALVLAKVSQTMLDQWRKSASASLCTERAGEVVATLHMSHSLGATLIVALSCGVAYLHGGSMPEWIMLVAPVANAAMVALLYGYEKQRVIFT